MKNANLLEQQIRYMTIGNIRLYLGKMMIKKLFVAAFILVTSLSAVAEDEVKLTQASETYINSVLDVCKKYAQEDEIKSEELTAYLLECLNDDLEVNNYIKVKELPKKQD